MHRLERAAEGVGRRAVRRGGHLRGERARDRDSRPGRLGLGREDVSTQVLPRDRHAELLQAIALAGAGLERFATEIRHLQRTEVREVEGPSAPALRRGRPRCRTNTSPILTERIVGIARLLRGYAQAGLEDVALWHERDISHSSVERVALPDATILLDYAQHLSVRVVEGMTVNAARMLENLEATGGALYSQRVLLALVESGRSATRPTGSCRRPPAARGRRARTFAPRSPGRPRARRPKRVRPERLRAPRARDRSAARPDRPA